MVPENKIKHGQFYTVRNPFTHPLVEEWVSKIQGISGLRFAEPFGGANNIIKLFCEAFPQVQLSQWSSYDIEPEAVSVNKTPQVPLVCRDTIVAPVICDVVVTNPPYLAKNSATRMGIGTDFGAYQDLYQVAVERMLQNSKYVAAIIPESFLTRTLFKERLFGFVSITSNLFDDTEFPVGLALWVPERTEDYVVYVGSYKVGLYREVVSRTTLLTQEISKNVKICFNDPDGALGLYAVDSPSRASIRFVEGSLIPSSEVKGTSRAITRISIHDGEGVPLVSSANLNVLIERLNSLLAEYREESYDLFMTSFKGIRKDGRYRRRLDWKTASRLINAAISV